MQNKRIVASVGLIIAVVLILTVFTQTKTMEDSKIIFQPRFGNTSVHLVQESFYKIELEYRMVDIETGTVDLTFYSDPEGEEQLLQDEELNWKSSDTTIATVENGMVNAIQPGSAVITISSDQTDCVVEFDVWVGSDAESIEGEETYSIPLSYQGIAIPFVYQPYGSLGMIEIELVDAYDDSTLDSETTEEEELFLEDTEYEENLVEEEYFDPEIQENDILQIVDGLLYPKAIGETIVTIKLMNTHTEVIDTLEVTVIITE